MAETPMTGRPPEMLQDCDRKLSMALSNTPGARLHAREAASEVEAARASLPAPTEDDWLKEAERLANRLVNRAALESSYSGGPLASKYRGERQAAQSLLMLHLRARPAEPTPDLYAAIMNLPQRPPDSAPPDWSWHDGYKIGHRDARHAAAELVAAAEPTPSASQETAMDSKPAAWMSREDFERLQADRWGIATATAYEQKSAAIPLFAAPPSDAAMTAESDTALLRQCLEALEQVTEVIDMVFGTGLLPRNANGPAAKARAAIDAARQALKEKP